LDGRAVELRSPRQADVTCGDRRDRRQQLPLEMAPVRDSTSAHGGASTRKCQTLSERRTDMVVHVAASARYGRQLAACLYPVLLLPTVSSLLIRPHLERQPSHTAASRASTYPIHRSCGCVFIPISQPTFRGIGGTHVWSFPEWAGLALEMTSAAMDRGSTPRTRSD
jgi:hypothetical protein